MRTEVIDLSEVVQKCISTRPRFVHLYCDTLECAINETPSLNLSDVEYFHVFARRFLHRKDSTYAQYLNLASSKKLTIALYAGELLSH
jgi:hypothetical protein